MKEIKYKNKGNLVSANSGYSPAQKKSSEKSNLHSRAELLDRIINDSLNIIIAVDKERRIVEFNQAAVDAFGYRKKEIIGKNINQLYADPAECEGIAGQIRREGKFQGRITNRRKNGEEFECQVSASVLHDEDGQIVGVVGNSRDITKDLLAEKALIESEETARILLDSSDDSIVLLDTSGKIIDLNTSAIKALDADKESLVGSSLTQWLNAGEQEILSELIETTAQSGLPVKYESEREIRLLGDSKFKVRFLNKLQPVLGERNQVIRLALFSTELWDEEKGAFGETGGGISSDEEKLFKVTVRQFPGIIWCVDKQLKFTLSDGLGLAVLGLKTGQVVGMSLFEFLNTEDLDHESIVKHKQALAGAIVNFETKVFEINFSCSIAPLRNREGEIIGALGIAFDITEHKKLERSVRIEKASYRELVENIDETIFSLDRQGRFTYISPTITNLLGYTPDEVIGREFYGFLYEEDLPLLQKLYQAVLQGEAKKHEMKLPCKNNGFRWVNIASKPIFTGRQITGISGIISDVTERITAQRALHESQQRYLNLVENIPVGMFITTPGPDGRFIMANRTTARIFGFETTEDIIGTLVTDRYFDPAAREAFLNKLIRAGEVIEKEEMLKKIDGTPVWCLVTARAIRDENGNVVTLDGIITDITSRKAAEEKLLISENRFKSIAEGSDDWIWEIGANLRIRYTNARVKEIIGYEPAEVIGKSLLDFMYEEDMDSERYADDYTLLSDKIFSGHQTILRHKKGAKVITESSGVPIFRRDRTFVGFQGLTKDISESILSKEKEELQRQQLIQADKMISLGILVSGVAHEINNPNQFIMINIPLLRRAWESVEPILEEYYTENGDFLLGGIPYSSMKSRMPELFSGIYNGSQRIKNIVSSLKGYAREGQPEEKTKISINEVIESSLVILANLIKNSTHNLQVKLSDCLPPVMGNFQRLEQVVINLIQNACQALENPQNGIEIRSEHEWDTGKVVLVIRDEGVGIKKRSMKYILDPFYTSKRDSGGTGLGLSISAGIIKDHDGTMEFKSAPGKGTTVRIILPGIEAV